MASTSIDPTLAWRRNLMLVARAAVLRDGRSGGSLSSPSRGMAGTQERWIAFGERGMVMSFCAQGCTRY